MLKTLCYFRSGTWTDYIYAEGQKIAKVDNFDVRLHITGTCSSNSSQCYAQWNIPAPPNNYVIQPGDHLFWRQYQSSGTGGLDLQFTNAESTWSSWLDTANAEVLDLPTQSQWTFRSADMSSYAGLTLYQFWIDAYPSVGPWDILFGDIAIVSAKGVVTPVYNRQLGVTPTLAFNTGPLSNMTAVSEQVLNSANPLTTDAATSTSYYLDDHLGTAQMELSSGGWPLWQGQFTPFGAELPDGSTAMHYKFTGKERDAESGLDYFGARYYASNMGRMMSPDNGSDINPADPQRWNLYVYSHNSPLALVDPDGHVATPAQSVHVASAIAQDRTLNNVFNASNNFSPRAFEIALAGGDSTI